MLQLLEKKKRVQLKDMGEDLECLCQIMRTVGPRLDHEKAKVIIACSLNKGASLVGLGCSFLTFHESFLFPVFNESVLWPHAILNEQQGLACKDPLLAAGYR